MTAVEDRDQVLVGMRTSFMRHGLTALLPGRFTLDETLKHIRQTPAKDPDTAEVLQQLEVETSGGEYHFLTAGRNGESKRAAPSTRLHEIATPREIKTARGVEVMPAAAVEVQGYARVGARRP